MHLSLFWLIAIPVGGTILAFIAGFIYLGYCDEYSARQFIKDAYLEGVKPAPAKFGEMWQRYRKADNAVPRRIRVSLKRDGNKPCPEDLVDPLARQRVRLERFLEGNNGRSTPATPLQRTDGISRAEMISSPTDSFEVVSSKSVPNTLSLKKSEPKPSKPEDESAEWPYR